MMDRATAQTEGSVGFLHHADEGHKISKLVNRVGNFTKMAAFFVCLAKPCTISKN